MKTNFRNIVAVSTVAFAGIFNANATENNSGLFTSTENTSVDYRTEAQLVTRWIADVTEAKATQQIMAKGFITSAEATTSFKNNLENTFEMVDFRAEAQSISREIADREEAKVTQKVMAKGLISPVETANSLENETKMNDFRIEAQLITREIADREEAIATQKVLQKGWVNSENGENLEDIDLLAEARLAIHLIADREEVKAFQKLVSEGKIAETK